MSVNGNHCLETFVITDFPVWMELWGLPIEYHTPDIAGRMAQVAGLVTQVDWENVLPRNQRFMRTLVLIDSEVPLNIAGVFLRKDVGGLEWIRFR